MRAHFMVDRVRKNLRLLPLPFCIALSLSAHAADQPPENWALCPIEEVVPAFADKLPAQQPGAAAPTGETEVTGDTLEGTEGQILNLDGNVSLRRGEQLLLADNLSYDQEKETYVAEGTVRYQDRGMRLSAARAKGDQGKDTHELEDIKYQLTRRRGNGGADRVVMDGNVGSLFGSTYSTCPPGARAWELHAKQIDVDTEEGMGTARHATLRIGRIPVLYLPWFRFPVDDRRRTGLLYPAISQSGRNGFDYRQPIYLNLAPNMDATLTPRWMSKRGLQLGGEFRYLTETGKGVLDGAFLPSDQLAERERDEEIAEGIPASNRRRDDRGYLRFVGNQNLGPQWQARANLGWVSDPRYLDDASNNLNGSAYSFVPSDIGIYGRGRYWEATFMADHWQLADYTLRDTNLPFNRLPRAHMRWDQPFTRWLNAGFDAEAIRFDHEVFSGGTRVDVRPFVQLSLEGDSWFLRPTLAWRYTSFQLGGDALDRALTHAQRNGLDFNNPLVMAPLVQQYRNDRITRSLPIGTIDAGVYFDRQASIGGTNYLHTLEPRLFYFNAPYRDQSGIPVFDTRPLTFGWGQLFRDNRYSGADRQADGNQLTLALSTRLIRESDGREKLSASLGQIRYFEDSRVTVPGEAPIEQGKSAWIADVNYAANDRWTIGASYQWDPKAGRRDLASVRTRYLIGDAGIVNLSYRYRRDLLEQADLSFLYPINPTWSLVGRYYYSLREDQMLEGIAGVQWESCCVAVRLVGRRYLRNRGEELNSAIQLEIELKGLGSAGPDTEGRLRRAILGYYREDLSLVPPPQTRGGGDLPSPDPVP